MISDVASYYQSLLADRVWYAEGLSWTVVQQLSLNEVCREAAAMAAVENATGARLSVELLDNPSGEPWRTVMLSRDLPTLNQM